MGTLSQLSRLLCCQTSRWMQFTRTQDELIIRTAYNCCWDLHSPKQRRLNNKKQSVVLDVAKLALDKSMSTSSLALSSNVSPTFSYVMNKLHPANL
ncbi:hypothetical protein IAQ61_005166 [Plenodomus lingam]|uniref:uncharacterized protein n=1 Tax=Leptosphaeria maculans TaxID=5022 RepID=UPI00332E5090|nr:hypothetical protein IAQ61_005166 [Plenodomus lingam]